MLYVSKDMYIFKKYITYLAMRSHLDSYSSPKMRRLHLHLRQHGKTEKCKNALGYLEEQNEYDVNGNLIRRKDALGILAEYTCDIANRSKNIWTGEALKAKEQTKHSESNPLSAIVGKPNIYI